MGDFYGTEIEIWAGLEPVGITEKKYWVDYEQLLRLVFSCFHGQKKRKKNHCSIRPKKLHKMKFKKINFFS